MTTPELKRLILFWLWHESIYGLTRRHFWCPQRSIFGFDMKINKWQMTVNEYWPVTKVSLNLVNPAFFTVPIADYHHGTNITSSVRERSSEVLHPPTPPLIRWCIAWKKGRFLIVFEKQCLIFFCICYSRDIEVLLRSGEGSHQGLSWSMRSYSPWLLLIVKYSIIITI